MRFIVYFIFRTFSALDISIFLMVDLASIVWEDQQHVCMRYTNYIGLESEFDDFLKTQDDTAVRVSHNS